MHYIFVVVVVLIDHYLHIWKWYIFYTYYWNINRGIITSWGRFYVKDLAARDVDRLLNNSQVHSSGVAVNIYLFSYYGHLLHEERLFQRRVRDMVRTFLFNLPLGCVLSIICIHKSCLLQCGLLFFFKEAGHHRLWTEFKLNVCDLAVASYATG